MSEQAVTEIRPHEHVLHVVILRRALDDESTHVLLDDVLTAAGQRIGVPIVIDLSSVRFAPSVALGALVQLSKSFTFEKRRIALVEVDRKIMGTIRVTQLDRVLEIHNKIEDVIGSAN